MAPYAPLNRALTGARTAPSNHPSSATADAALPLGAYAPVEPYPAADPVDPAALRYAAAWRGRDGTGEYLVWAVRGGAPDSDPAGSGSGPVLTRGATARILSGELSVVDAAAPGGVRADGSPTMEVTAPAGPPREVLTVSYRRPGGPTAALTAGVDFSYEAKSGVLRLNDTPAVRAAVGVAPGDPVAASAGRGDTVEGVSYRVGGARFRWSRNDPNRTRFDWSGADGRWKPLPGGAVRELGVMGDPTVVWSVGAGEVEPGSYVAGTASGWASVRVGAAPDESSYAVVERTTGLWSGLRGVAEPVDVETHPWEASSPPDAGVVVSSSGAVQWNPAFAAAYAGLPVWHGGVRFGTGAAGGRVGEFTATGALYLAPAPHPGEEPLVRCGTRGWLTPRVVASEAELAALTLEAGEVGVARSTGAVRFSPEDLDRLDPEGPAFDPSYLGAEVVYDGVACGPEVPMVAACAVLDATGAAVTSYVPGMEMYVPVASAAPGMGRAGVARIPDGTGREPDLSLDSNGRPGPSGLIRSIDAAPGDRYLRADDLTLAEAITVAGVGEFPTDPYRVSGSAVYVSLETGTHGARLYVGAAAAERLRGRALEWVEARVTPAYYAARTELIARLPGPYTLTGAETVTLRVDGTDHTWSVGSLLGAGTWNAAEVAAAFPSVAGVAAEVEGTYWKLEGADPMSGIVALGWDEAWGALGMGPGWVADRLGATGGSPTDPNWLPDSGVCFGLARPSDLLEDPVNGPLVRALGRVEGVRMVDAAGPTPYQLLSPVPREDLPGYSLSAFYATGTGAAARPLRPGLELHHEFTRGRWGWLGRAVRPLAEVTVETDTLDLGAPVVATTLNPAAGGRLAYGAPGQPATDRAAGVGYELGADGRSVTLTAPRGAVKSRGWAGAYVAATTSFTDSRTPSWVGRAAVGDHLAVADSDGVERWYRVTAVPGPSLTVQPAFQLGSGSSPRRWRLAEGAALSSPERALVAAPLWRAFDPVGENPITVTVLTSLGPADGLLEPVDPAVVAGARAGSLSIRYGVDGAAVTAEVLTPSRLGAAARDGLAVEASGPHWETGRWAVRVGETVYEQGPGGELVGVEVFSSDPGATIEYLNAGPEAGALRLGSGVVGTLGGAAVEYVPRILPDEDLSPGTAQVDAETGEVALAEADRTAAGTTPVFIGRELDPSSYTMNPVAGSFTLAEPVRSGQWVEATYWRAVPDTGALYRDATGAAVQVRERLPHHIREAGVRVNAQLYTFNGAGLTPLAEVPARVYVGVREVTYGVPVGAAVNLTGGRVSLTAPVTDPATAVSVSYAVGEARGGETTYRVSAGPMWRPPFRLAAGVRTFDLMGDRTAEWVAGVVVRVDGWCAYVEEVSYLSATDVTRVTVAEGAPGAVGSLNPGAPALTLVSDRVLGYDLDPSSAPLMPTAAELGGLDGAPHWSPVTRGSTRLDLAGDWGALGVTRGSLVELEGVPFLITAVAVTEHGGRTILGLGSPAPREFLWSTTTPPGAVRFSVVPLYPEGAAALEVGGTPYEIQAVVRYPSAGGAGGALVEGVDYRWNATTRVLSLTTPLAAGERIAVPRRDRTLLRPRTVRGYQAFPRWAAEYGYVTAPTAENGWLGVAVEARFSYAAPDTFYVRSVEWSALEEEKLPGLSAAAGEATATGSAPTYSTGTPNRAARGFTGAGAAARDAAVTDTVARWRWSQYGTLVTGLYALGESYTGIPVGDRDGQMGAWVGRGHPWCPPGYEDEARSTLNPLNVWCAVVWPGLRGGLTPITLTPADPLVEPVTAAVDLSGAVVGSEPNGARLDELIGLQRGAVRNVLDDRLLVGAGARFRQFTGPITGRTVTLPTYRAGYEPSPLSRPFPERAGVAGVTADGVGADDYDGGYYTAGRVGPEGVWTATRGTPIATLSTLARGPVGAVRSVRVRPRRARARVVGYAPEGYAAYDAGTAGRPTFMATPGSLASFPRDGSGEPDFTRLAAETGDPVGAVEDLTTGAPARAIPPFLPGDRLAVGRADGTRIRLGYAGTLIGADYAPVVVEAVLRGALVTVGSQDSGGAPIPVTDPATLVEMTGLGAGRPYVHTPGSTLYVVAGGAAPTGLADPPTASELALALDSLEEWRVGLDVELRGASGELVDATLPSGDDGAPVPLLEITGQRPPPPRTPYEGWADVTAPATDPVEPPAMAGGGELDSGDHSLPYPYATANERDALAELFPVGVGLLEATSVDPALGNPPPAGCDPYTVELAYPDECRGTDGSTDPGDTTRAAALITGVDLSGVRPYDPLYVEAGSNGTPALPGGACGILSVGAVTGGGSPALEPARFVSAVNAGSLVEIALERVQCWTPSEPGGVEVEEDASVPGVVVTTLDVSSIAPDFVVWDDGVGGGSVLPPTGGFNTFMVGAAVGATVTVTLFENGLDVLRPTAAVIIRKVGGGATVADCLFEVTGNGVLGSYQPVTPGGLWWNEQRLTVTTTVGWFDFGWFGPITVSPGVTRTDAPHGFTVSCDALVGSSSFTIGSDRLTVRGPVDPRTARPRGSLSSEGEELEFRLTTVKCATRLYNTLAAAWQEELTSVNSTYEINAGAPFTFPWRSQGPYSAGVGAFGAGVGAVRVPAWEAAGNVSLGASTGIRYTVGRGARSSDEGPILDASFVSDQLDGTGVTRPWPGDPRFVLVGVERGALERVRPGDYAIVEAIEKDPGVALASAVTKAGTYLVHDRVVPNHGTREQRRSFTCAAGEPGGWVSFTWPRVGAVTGTGLSLTLTATGLPTIPAVALPLGADVASAGAFSSAGRVYVVVSSAALSSASSVEYAGGLVSAAYALHTPGDGTFTGLSDFRDALGAAVTEEAFVAGARVGRVVTGMYLAPTRVSAPDLAAGLPGYTSYAVGERAAAGCRAVTFTRGTSSLTYEAGSAAFLQATAGVTKLQPLEHRRVAAGTYDPASTPPYRSVVAALELSDVDWDRFHTTGAFVPAGARCLLPGDRISVDYSAAAGLYLEPNWPVSGGNYGGTAPRAVYPGNALAPGEVGVRRLVDWCTGTPPAGYSLEERVRVEVRRGRRFQSVGAALGGSLRKLRLAYETRRGLVATATATGATTRITVTPVGRSPWLTADPAGAATPCGSFEEARVAPGDDFLLPDPTSGEFRVVARVVTVETDTDTVTVSPPVTAAPGTPFELHLRSPAPPQAQTLDRLLAAATTPLFVRAADADTGAGGRVPWNVAGDAAASYRASCGRLRDGDPTVDYEEWDVAPGDLIVVDPAGPLSPPGGPLSPPEWGAAPRGDAGVAERAGEFVAGGPAPADDNRGVYRVTAVTGPELRVTVPGGWVGAVDEDPVVFGSGTGTPWVLYPTVSASALSGGDEGAGDLRPTAAADPGTGSYRLTARSVEPFSYRVVRPDPTLDRAAVEFVAVLRDRLLSWAEAVARADAGLPGASYREWVAASGPEDLCARVPEEPRFLVTDPWLEGFLGRRAAAPLVGGAAAASVLERRGWVGDPALVPHYLDGAAQGHPTGPELIAAHALGGTARWAEKWAAWYRVRARRGTGTLEAAQRALRALLDGLNRRRP